MNPQTIVVEYTPFDGIREAVHETIAWIVISMILGLIFAGGFESVKAGEVPYLHGALVVAVMVVLIGVAIVVLTALWRLARPYVVAGGRAIESPIRRFDGWLESVEEYYERKRRGGGS